jgi:hypothetical protein
MAEMGRASQVYQIKVRGEIDACWSDWFEGVDIASDGDVTTLTGPIIDQAVLRGILTKIWDLNLTLISVKPVEATADQDALVQEVQHEADLSL